MRGFSSVIPLILIYQSAIIVYFMTKLNPALSELAFFILFLFSFVSALQIELRHVGLQPGKPRGGERI